LKARENALVLMIFWPVRVRRINGFQHQPTAS
jgi:hypothetical protein